MGYFEKNVIEDAFGGQADYAQLHKVYSAAQENETRYSPARCVEECDERSQRTA